LIEYWLRHMMAVYMASEEIKGPSMRTDDQFPDERLRRQFSPLIENTYCLVETMLQVGDQRPPTSGQ